MNRLRVLAHYAAAKLGRRFRTREALEAWQEGQMQDFLRQILPQSPYYRARIEPRRWREAPLTEKASMMRHFDALNTVGLKKAQALKTALKAERERDWSPLLHGVSVGLSSGTSGHRGLFLASPAEQEAWAGLMLARALPQPIWVPQRVALFLRSNSNLYESLGKGGLRFAYFDMQEDLESQAAKLQDFNPSILVAPPSVLLRLAGMDLKLKPSRIFSVAEVLEPQDRLKIEAAFGQALGQVYQATEGFLGISCRYGSLHLNEDVMVVQKEWLDRGSRRFSPVISDFRRRSQPILRYRLNDILTEKAEACLCGSAFTAIESIEGRQDDLCYFPKAQGRGLKPVYADFIRRAVLQASAAIEDYRVVQEGPRRVAIALRVSPGSRSSAQAGVRREFKRLARDFQFQAPGLRFNASFSVLGSAKLRRVQRRFSLKATEGNG